MYVCRIQSDFSTYDAARVFTSCSDRQLLHHTSAHCRTRSRRSPRKPEAVYIKLSLSRAILKKPAILVLDEAASALDSMNEQIVQEALDSVVFAAHERRTTMTVIAHHLSTIQNADKICVLNGSGGIAEQGDTICTSEAVLGAATESGFAIAATNVLLEFGSKSIKSLTFGELNAASKARKEVAVTMEISDRVAQYRLAAIEERECRFEGCASVFCRDEEAHELY